MSHRKLHYIKRSNSPIVDISDELVLQPREVPVITLDSDSDSDDDVVVLDPPKRENPDSSCLVSSHDRIRKLYKVFQTNEVDKIRDENRKTDSIIRMVGSVTGQSAAPKKEDLSFEESEEGSVKGWESPESSSESSSSNDSDSEEEEINVAEDPLPVQPINTANDALEKDAQLARDVHEFTNKFRKRKFIMEKNQFFSSASVDNDRAVLARLWHGLLGGQVEKCKEVVERAERWKEQQLSEECRWNSEPSTGEEHNGWISRMDITLLRASLEEMKFEFKSLEQGYWNFEVNEIDNEWRRYRKTIKELLEDVEQTESTFFSFSHFTIRDVAEKKTNDEEPEQGPPFRKFWMQGLHDLIKQNGRKTKLIATFLKRMKRRATVKNALDINDMALKKLTDELDKVFDEDYHLPKGLLFRQLILNVADIFFYNKFTKDWLIVHPRNWKLLDRIPVDLREIKHILNPAAERH